MRERYGLNAAVLLMQLVFEYTCYKEDGRLTDGVYFYSTIEHLEKETCLSRHDQTKAIGILGALNILHIELKGVPAKRHFYIDFEAIAALFDRMAQEKKAEKPRNSQIVKNSQTRLRKIDKQDSEILTTNNNIYNNDNNEIDRLKDYIKNTRISKAARAELEQEFIRLEIGLDDDFVKILSEKSHHRFLLLQAGVASVFCTPHRYKLSVLNYRKLINLYDKYREYAEKTGIDEPVRYFKKILLEYLDEKIPV